MDLGLQGLSLNDGISYETDLNELSLNDARDINDEEVEDVEMEDVVSMSTPAVHRASRLLSAKPTVSSPLSKWEGEVVQDCDLPDEDITMEDSDVSNNSFSKSVSLVFSPTALGAQLATGSPRLRKVNLTEKLYELQNETTELDTDESDSSASVSSPASSKYMRNRNKPRTPSKLSRYVTNSCAEETSQDYTTEDDTESSMMDSPSKFQTPMVQWRGRNNNQPIQFQMHHHHYYPPSPNNDSSMMDHSQSQQQIILPAPWSKFASPKAPTPYLISSYLQLIFNAFTSSIVIYVLISAIRTVRADINNKMEEYASEIVLDIQRCTRSYLENRCAPETRVSALEQICIEWERCMNRDPRILANKASVSAETLGIILNSLIEPIGVKAIVVVGMVLAGWTFASNFIFGFVRAKSYYGWDANGQQQVQHQQQGYDNPQLTYQQVLPPSGELSPIKLH